LASRAERAATPVGAGERGPAASVVVERREAPHPYVIGVRAPSQRRAADRATVRRALAEAPGASRRSISLACKGKEKRGKGDARRPKIECLGRRKRWLFDIVRSWVRSAKMAVGFVPPKWSLGSFRQMAIDGGENHAIQSAQVP